MLWTFCFCYSILQKEGLLLRLGHSFSLFIQLLRASTLKILCVTSSRRIAWFQCFSAYLKKKIVLTDPVVSIIFSRFFIMLLLLSKSVHEALCISNSLYSSLYSCVLLTPWVLDDRCSYFRGFRACSPLFSMFFLSFLGLLHEKVKNLATCYHYSETGIYCLND